jgi:DNA processing protein
MPNNDYLLLLNALFYDSPKTAYLALSQFETESEFSSNFSTFLSTLKNKSQDIYKKREASFTLTNYKNELKNKGIKALFLTDDHYPKDLKEIHFPPIVLFYKGNINLLSDPLIACVGPRKNSSYGTEVCEYFCNELLPYFRIVSGLAEGIDTIAHKTALKRNEPTIAIIGNGFDTIYPYSNKQLYKDIETKGLLLSEFPPSVKPLPFHFPLRNRIVSGVSKGVLVCEASEKSGSLITANTALEQNREVFVCPGSIFSDYSKGSNKLIQAGAKCVQTITDIINELNIKEAKFNVINKKSAQNSSTNNNALLNYLSKTPTDLEELLQRSKETLPSLLQQLVIYESQGLIKKLPGNQYIKV